MIPVRVYRVELSANQSIPIPQQNSKSDTSPSKPKLLIVAIVMALVVAGGAAYWFKTQEPKIEAASIDRMAFPLPDKPSIAVLPFTNMSNDAEQEYFVDGIDRGPDHGYIQNIRFVRYRAQLCFYL